MLVLLQRIKQNIL